MAVTTAFITGVAFWLLISAGIMKLARPRTDSALAGFRAPFAGRVFRQAAGGVEAIAAALLVLPETARLGLFAVTALFALFTLAGLVSGRLV